MKRLIVIAGPTASGKTALSIALAKTLNAVVISADSRQFYKELSIGTAKPSIEEMDGIKHYLVDSHPITDEINSARFAELALKIIETEFKVRETIILVGGSGMFIDALCYGLDDLPHDKAVQNQLNGAFNTNGLEPLLAELEAKDPEFYQQIDKSNPVRIIRALEVIRITNEKFSSLRKGEKRTHAFAINYFVVNPPRELLYERINLRVDKMIATGLEEEARSVLPYRHLKSLATVGYREFFDYFDGKIDYQTAVELVKQNSRRYAKRQITWFKRNPDAIWIPFGTTEEMKEFVVGRC
ncbi:MAG TPA: tRNA (adenosine(37)-N6)-dimethylallyltransferase MiaA [Taishania sp.]|nr:tRNA (adenosine(37)-N6)-dimethylallyltransferase MiaA [Taishania sp.]